MRQKNLLEGGLAAVAAFVKDSEWPDSVVTPPPRKECRKAASNAAPSSTDKVAAAVVVVFGGHICNTYHQMAKNVSPSQFAIAGRPTPPSPQTRPS